MPTIVTYTDTAPPRNEYPRRIISPTRSSRCCFSGMVTLGAARVDERHEYVYRRCRTCGFTVCVIVRYLPDQALLTDVRQRFATLLARNIRPD